MAVYDEPLAVWEHALLEDDVDTAPLFWGTAYELGWPF